MNQHGQLTCPTGRRVDFSPDAVGVGKEVSLTDALVALSMLWKVTIVLVIDEARFVMTSENRVPHSSRCGSVWLRRLDQWPGGQMRCR